MTTTTDLPLGSDIIVPDLPDLSEPPLDAEAVIDDAECARIMRRAIGDSDAGAKVCAFNSSI